MIVWSLTDIFAVNSNRQGPFQWSYEVQRLFFSDASSNRENHLDRDNKKSTQGTQGYVGIGL